MLLEILGAIAPVLAIVALGLLWARRGLPFDTDTIGTLVVLVGTPTLIFSTLTNAPVALDEVGRIALAAGLVIALSALVGAVVLRLAGLPRHTWLMTAMHGNSGNMGLPLAAMVFGAEGLALAIAYFLVVSISQHTLGLAISAGRFEARSLARQPVIWASAATVAVILLDLPVPVWAARTTELLAGIVIPTMLILLGVSLSRLKVADLRLASGMAAMRFGAGAAAALAAIPLLGLSGAEAGVVWLMATMPAAVANVVYAQRFGRSPDKVAGTIVVSTGATLAGLPLLVWVALRIAGG